MRARYIQYVDGPACMERVGAQHDHFLTGERSIKLLFVFAEFLPMVCFDPERVSADPYSAACAAINPWPDACHLAWKGRDVS